MTYSEVTEVSGYVGNYSVTVTHRPRYVKTGGSVHRVRRVCQGVSGVAAIRVG